MDNNSSHLPGTLGTTNLQPSNANSATDAECGAFSWTTAFSPKYNYTTKNRQPTNDSKIKLKLRDHSLDTPGPALPQLPNGIAKSCTVGAVTPLSMSDEIQGR